MHALSGPKAGRPLDLCWKPCRSPGLICFIPWPSRAMGWKSGKAAACCGCHLELKNHILGGDNCMIVVWVCVCLFWESLKSGHLSSVSRWTLQLGEYTVIIGNTHSVTGLAIFNSFFVCLPEGISTALLESTKQSIGISRKNGGTNGLVEWVNGSRMFLDWSTVFGCDYIVLRCCSASSCWTSSG